MLTYAEPHRWNFTFQHYVQLSRLNLQNQQSDKKIQIFERSLQNNRLVYRSKSLSWNTKNGTKHLWSKSFLPIDYCMLGLIVDVYFFLSRKLTWLRKEEREVITLFCNHLFQHFYWFLTLKVYICFLYLKQLLWLTFML